MSLLQQVGADLDMAPSRQPRVLQLLTVRGAAAVGVRLARSLGARVSVLGFFAKQWTHFLTGADIAWQASIDRGLYLPHPTGVVIGPQARIGTGVTIHSCVTLGGSGSPDDARVTIGDGVVIGTGAKVLGSVTIGVGARIGANAVVLSDVPAGATAVGVPARVLVADAKP